MKAAQVLKAFAQAKKRVYLVNNLDARVIVGLDLENRSFTTKEPAAGQR